MEEASFGGLQGKALWALLADMIETRGGLDSEVDDIFPQANTNNVSWVDICEILSHSHLSQRRTCIH